MRVATSKWKVAPESRRANEPSAPHGQPPYLHHLAPPLLSRHGLGHPVETASGGTGQPSFWAGAPPLRHTAGLLMPRQPQPGSLGSRLGPWQRPGVQRHPRRRRRGGPAFPQHGHVPAAAAAASSHLQLVTSAHHTFPGTLPLHASSPTFSAIHVSSPSKAHMRDRATTNTANFHDAVHSTGKWYPLLKVLAVRECSTLSVANVDTSTRTDHGMIRSDDDPVLQSNWRCCHACPAS